jgi:hypothetical protein
METSAIVRELQDRQTSVSRRLAQIQQQLYKLEEQYLDATQVRGNIVRGWEGFLDFKPRSAMNNSAKKERRTKASDRMFSFSSIGAPIPKSELDKDEETSVALKWAEEYEKASIKTAAELAKSAISSQASSTSPAQPLAKKAKLSSN